MQPVLSIFLGVIVFGLLHDLNPSHGWIVGSSIVRRMVIMIRN
jgi:hypothetical protein